MGVLVQLYGVLVQLYGSTSAALWENQCVSSMGLQCSPMGVLVQLYGSTSAALWRTKLCLCSSAAVDDLGVAGFAVSVLAVILILVLLLCLFCQRPSTAASPNTNPSTGFHPHPKPRESALHSILPRYDSICLSGIFDLHREIAPPDDSDVYMNYRSSNPSYADLDRDHHRRRPLLQLPLKTHATWLFRKHQIHLLFPDGRIQIEKERAPCLELLGFRI
ncbi:hypothetical protein WMY93_000934 [Mugilogobius chulae]|uniref:Uncharacterized protein n=1 Tax=Mugilogobius chulae TaxID=88201 RepID=A0AAW0Q297_9GOBI